VTVEQLVGIEKKITAIYGPALADAETVWYKGASKSLRGAVGVAYGGRERRPGRPRLGG